MIAITLTIVPSMQSVNKFYLKEYLRLNIHLCQYIISDKFKYKILFRNQKLQKEAKIYIKKRHN